MRQRISIVLLGISVGIALACPAQTIDASLSGSSKSSAFTSPDTTTAYEPYFYAGLPEWKRAYLVHNDPETHRISLWDLNREVRDFRPKLEGATKVSVTDVEVAPDKSILVSGGAIKEGGKIIHFVGRVQDDDGVSPLVETNGFVPRALCSSDGKTVWAAGFIGGADSDTHSILREYRLSDAKMLRAVLDAATFPKWPLAVEGRGTKDFFLQCAHDKVGMYAGATDEWIQYDVSKGELKRWKLPKLTHHWVFNDKNGRIIPNPVERTEITGLAMLDSGEVYASFIHYFRGQPKERSFGLFKLQASDREAHWHAVEGTLSLGDHEGDFLQLHGADGKQLVYSRFKRQGWALTEPPL